jgi:hypothetical protein
MHSHVGTRGWVASSACCSRGHHLLAHHIDVTEQSPTAHPHKRLSRGVIDGPQTITTATRGKRDGYTCCLLSPELLIPSQSFCLLPYYTANTSSQDHGGADEVVCQCGVPRGIPRWRQPPVIWCPATPISSVKVICLLNQIVLPLILYGLEVGLHCAALHPW